MRAGARCGDSCDGRFAEGRTLVLCLWLAVRSTGAEWDTEPGLAGGQGRKPQMPSNRRNWAGTLPPGDLSFPASHWSCGLDPCPS